MGAGKKERRRITSLALIFLGLSVIFPACFSVDVRLFGKKKTADTNRFASSAIFPIKGNVYPLGYYSVFLSIGSPSKAFEFDIDSGSDLTWVQCDAPCTGCTVPPAQLYKPKNNAVHCGESMCAELEWQSRNPCKNPDEQCGYEIQYADHGSSLGVLVNDFISFKFINGSVAAPRVFFGCGYDQKYSGPHQPPLTAGVLGLGNGKVSIFSQLHARGIVRNVVGHCLSAQGGGYLFLGNDVVPSSGVAWMPMSRDSLGKHYTSGPAEVYFGGKAVGIRGLTLVFDSGSSYTYFNSRLYKSILDLVTENLKSKPLTNAPEENSLPECWKGKKPFRSLQEVKNYFKTLAFSFSKAGNVQIQIPPEAYLIVTKYGNVCLGILNGTEVGLENNNIIGDISMQDRMVIYDNEKRQVGWVPADCNRFPGDDGETFGGVCQPNAANFDILAQYSPYDR